MNRIIVLLLVLSAPNYLAFSQDVESDLEALKKVMKFSNVKIEHKEKLVQGTDVTPSQKEESWKFLADRSPMVKYNRYLNIPPYFTGNYPSLTNSDMGIGFDGDSFGNWYYNNTIRVYINGQDIFAERSATEVEHREGKNGYLRFIWKLENKDYIIMYISVPDDGHAIYVKIEFYLSETTIKSTGVILSCYPGGFGPYHKLPSHRWVLTSKNEAEVPKGTKSNPVIPVNEGEEWIFYADKYVDNGSLGLIMLSEEKPSGEVIMSGYGQATCLNYPADTKTIHFGFYAFNFSDSYAKEFFLSSLDRELSILRNISFWDDEEK